MVVRGDFSVSLTLRDIELALAWTAGAFLVMPLWFFIRGKTDERTLTTSPEGIFIEIGLRKEAVPWSKVKLIANTRRHVLIVGITGNALWIPSRAFPGPDQQSQFAAQIDDWRNAKAG